MRERFLLLALVLFCSPPAGAQTPLPVIQVEYDLTKKSKTRLTVTPLFDQLPPSGYYPVRVAIFNDATIDREWIFDFTSRDGDLGRGNVMRSSFPVRCPNKEGVEVDLIVPLVTAFYEDMSASVTLEIDVKAPPGLRGSNNSVNTDYNEDWPAVLVSDYLDVRNGSPISSAISVKLSGGGSMHPGSFVATAGIEFGAAFNPKQMPQDWRAFSGYDWCLLTEDDWKELHPGVKTALLKWNRLGGNLIVYSQNAGTNLATLNIDKSAPGTRTAARSWGSVQVEALSSTGLLPPETTIDAILDLPGRTGSNRLHDLRHGFRPHWPLQAILGAKTAHIVFFILVLIAFGILVGPVNLFVFARAGQRHRLFITTPLISLGASVLLVVLILFQDGFGGRGQRLVLMEIGPDNMAYLAQEQIARTGVLLNTGFTTPEHGYLSPVMLADSRWARITEFNGGGEGRYTIDLLENGIKVAGDWFKSRSEHGHIFETIRPTRGRVNLVQAGDGPVINSTFEFSLEKMFYLAPNGDLWTGEDIQQGRNTNLRIASDGEFNSWLAAEKSRFSGRNQRRLTLTEARPGHFFATTTEATGVNTLRSINWIETRTLVTGQVVAP